NSIGVCSGCFQSFDAKKLTLFHAILIGFCLCRFSHLAFGLLIPNLNVAVTSCDAKERKLIRVDSGDVRLFSGGVAIPRRNQSAGTSGGVLCSAPARCAAFGQPKGSVTCLRTHW